MTYEQYRLNLEIAAGQRARLIEKAQRQFDVAERLMEEAQRVYEIAVNAPFDGDEESI